MADRIFRVWSNKGEDGIDKFFVTDQFDGEKGRASVAIFPVGKLYDEHSQRTKAKQYCDFMNKIAEATKKAYEQTLIMDILKK